MSYRLVYGEFWSDPKVMEEMTPEDRYFYLFLLTNPNTTSCGIYTITKKQMAFQLGYSPEVINCLMDRFENRYKVIKYNPETRELAIKNWGKYNLCRGGKPVIDCFTSELKKVKDKTLIQYVEAAITNPAMKELYRSFYGRSTDSERDGIPQGDNTDTYTDTNTNTYTERDTDTNINTIVYTERDTRTNANTNANTNTLRNTNINTNTNPNPYTDPYTESYIAEKDINTEKNIDSARYIDNKKYIDADRYMDIDLYKEKGIQKDTDTNTHKEKEIDSLTLSILQEYEKISGNIGKLDYAAVRFAVINHGQNYVKMAIDRALEKGKLNMAYVNGILRTWAKEGYPKEGGGSYDRSSGKNNSSAKGEFYGFKPKEPIFLTEEEICKVARDLI